MRNVYACLVHESAACVVDLVRNLRYNDPKSDIILYNGGRSRHLLSNSEQFKPYNVLIYPTPRSLRWGRLHDFALDCMRFALEECDFDILTIVDSDQLCVRSGYCEYIDSYLFTRFNTGLLGKMDCPQPPTTTKWPAVAAWREIDLWRPFLRRFTCGEEKFPMWTFWPSTIFTADAALALTDIFDRDEQLKSILLQSRIWASEEIILPTVTALLGFQVDVTPCCGDYVKYSVHYNDLAAREAFLRNDVYWIHPVPREYDNDLRRAIRGHCNGYEIGARSCPQGYSTLAG